MYLLLVTARESRGDVVAGLDAGADDYIIKPFDPEELRARVAVGTRVLGLQQKLAERVEELQTALSNVKTAARAPPDLQRHCEAYPRGRSKYWQHGSRAASHRSRSPFIACAVIAMIGRCWPALVSRARMAAVASKPPISGICTSISTTSNGCRADDRGERLAAVAGDRHLVAAPLEQARGQPLVDGVVLREQHVQAALGQVGRQHRRGQRRPLSRLAREGAADRAQQLALIDRLGQVRRDADLAAPCSRRTGPTSSAS